MSWKSSQNPILEAMKINPSMRDTSDASYWRDYGARLDWLTCDQIKAPMLSQRIYLSDIIPLEWGYRQGDDVLISSRFWASLTYDWACAQDWLERAGRYPQGLIAIDLMDERYMRAHLRAGKAASLVTSDRLAGLQDDIATAVRDDRRNTSGELRLRQRYAELEQELAACRGLLSILD